MERKTFVLSKRKTYRRPVKIFVKDSKGVLSEMWITFTTEHLVNKEVRHTNGRLVAAEFMTNDPKIIDAIYSNSSYGKDFYEKGDEKGLKKAETIAITADDVEKMALKSLFESAGLTTYDAHKPVAILKKELQLYMESVAGKKFVESPPKEIQFEKKDIAADLEKQKQDAREYYEAEYGKPVPSFVYDDVAFLDGLSNPSFDPEKYIEQKDAELFPNGHNNSGLDFAALPLKEAPEGNKESLHAAYFEKFSKKVPNMKVNDLGWIKAKLSE